MSDDPILQLFTTCIARLVGSVCSYRTESWEGWRGVLRQEFSLLYEADVNAVIVESES